MKKKNLIIIIISVVLLVGVSISVILLNNRNKQTKENISSQETENTYDVSQFTEITTKKFLEIAAEKEISFIYLGRATCSHCVDLIPTLKAVQKKYGYTTYYIDITKVNKKAASYKSFIAFDDFITEKYGTTPMLLITQNNKLLSHELGTLSEEELTQFLMVNGVIN